MTSEEYSQKFTEDAASGWLAMETATATATEKVYGSQEPRHFGSVIKYLLGGPDPLNGTSIYDSQEQTFHRHIVSYRMS